MAKLINDTYTGTGSVGSFPPNCENCPRIVSPNSTSTPKHPTENSLYELVANSLVTISELQKNVTKIEKEQEKNREFYRSITALSKTSRKALWLIMAIPLIQLIACTAVVYFLGIQEELPSLLIWILSGVSLLSIAEVLITVLKYFILENKVSDLEKKIEKIEDK